MNEIAIYDRIQNPLDAVKQFGLAIHQSGMFGTAAAQQGEVLAMECLARRMPPLMLAERYHIIFGKLSMKADATLAEFLASGGKHEIVERTPDRASIRLIVDGKQQEFSLSWEEAKQEPFVYEGKEKDILKKLANGRDGLEIKAKYQTPRARMQMLWARVVSDGVRAMMPTVNCGVYTPEEIEDFSGHDDDGQATKKTRVRQPRPEATDVAADAQTANAADAIDVPFDDVPVDSAATETVGSAGAEQVDAQPKATSPAPASDKAEKAPGSGGCTADQQKRIKELWGLAEISVEDRDKQLAKRHCSVVKNLTVEQADELLGKLEVFYAKRQQANQPCTPELANQVKAKLVEVEQQLPGASLKIKAKIQAAGYEKLTELTYGEVASLLDALTGGTMEQFFGVDLWPTPKAKGSDSKN